MRMNGTDDESSSKETVAARAGATDKGKGISRRKMLVSLGAAGAAVAASSWLGARPGEATVLQDVYGNPAGLNADKIRYRFATGLAERTAGDKFREWVSVKDFGAQGDGVTDDTGSINAAIDYVHQSGGGTVFVPRGIYQIQASKAGNTVAGGVVLKSNIRLTFDHGAAFRAIPNASVYSTILSIFECENVHIDGGNLIGERDSHIGTTGEWGHGIFMFQCNGVTLQHTTIRDCWGDGLYLREAEHVTAINCVSDRNRRQGMSIISGERLYFSHCSFTNTNGTAPESGVDLEPNAATETVRHVTFDHCKLTGNNGRGFVLGFRRGAVGEQIRVLHSDLTGNQAESVRIACRASTVNGITLDDLAFGTIDMGISGDSAIEDVKIARVQGDQILIRNVVRLSVAESRLSGRALLQLIDVSYANIQEIDILNSTGVAVSLDYGYNEHVVLDRLHLLNGAGNGIQASEATARFVQVINSVIEGCASAGITGVGSDWTISHNTIRNNGTYGIKLESTAQRNLLVCNRLEANTSGNISTNGDPTNVIEHNISV